MEPAVYNRVSDTEREACREARDGDMDAACQKALEQIRDTGYEAELRDDGVEHILKYGIACYKKRCRVVSERAGDAEENM